MQEIKEIFEHIQATSSRTGKEQILRDNKDNQLFRDTLHFLLNPYITTGLSEKKINKEVSYIGAYIFNDAMEVIKYIARNNTGSDAVISSVQWFIEKQPKDMQEFYEGLFTKSIKLGCAANTVNKIFGKGFVPQFECQLAQNYADYTDKVNGKEFTLTTKLDGIRAILIKDGDSVSIFSRQGQRIEGLVDIEREMLAHPNKHFVLDGELLISDIDGIPSKEQYKATTKIVRKDGDKKGVTFWAFDFMLPDEFYNQKCTAPYTERRVMLWELLEYAFYIRPLPVLYSGDDMSQIFTLLEKVRAEGQEGIMLNINDAPYEFKRTQNLLKIKVFQDCDLEIIGFEEGSGRLAGTLGRVNVEYKGGILGVGSGFTDVQRAWFWENRDELMGRVITVQYFEETQDKDGKLSLRFPVFVGLCDEGKEVNI